MFVWWDSLSVASQVFALVAIPMTIVLLIQTVLMFIGIGGEADGPEFGDSEADIDVGETDAEAFDSLHIFTVRGIIAFFVVFGWVGFLMDSARVSLWITVPTAIVCGAAMMMLLALLFKAVMKLRSGGNLDNSNAIGTAGTVYLAIPPAHSGVGKVNILLQGSYVEREAVTDEEETIPTGAEIVVTGVSGRTALIVRRK